VPKGYVVLLNKDAFFGPFEALKCKIIAGGMFGRMTVYGKSKKYR
jgi:hypothetical protein